MKTTQWTAALELYEATIGGEGVRNLLCFEADEDAGCISCYFGSTNGNGVRLLIDQDGRRMLL